MNKSLLFSSLCLVLSVYCFTWAEGIECYDCVYIDGDDVPKEISDMDGFDKSCNTGKKPKKSLLSDCGSGDICAKFYAEKSATILGGGEITGRACLSKVNDLLNKCIDNKTTTELIGYNDVTLIAFVSLIQQDQKPTICTCDEDKCNSSSMLKMSQGVSLLSLAFLVTKYAGLI